MTVVLGRIRAGDHAQDDFMRNYVDLHHPPSRPLMFPQATNVRSSSDVISVTYEDFVAAIRDALAAGVVFAKELR